MSSEQWRDLELLNLKVSPYSRRVRWVLHLVGVLDRVKISQHVVMLGELALRLRVLGLWALFRPGTRVSVPVLFATNVETREKVVLQDGVTITSWVDRCLRPGAMAPVVELADVGQKDEVRRYCEMTDLMLAYGRTRLVEKCLEDENLLLEFVPKAIRGWPWLARWFAWVGVIWFRWKYSVVSALSSEAKAKEVMAEFEEVLVSREAASSGKVTFLVGDHLTLADIYVACAVDFFVPMRPLKYPLTASEQARTWKYVEKACPKLVEYARRIFNQHYTISIA